MKSNEDYMTTDSANISDMQTNDDEEDAHGSGQRCHSRRRTAREIANMFEKLKHRHVAKKKEWQIEKETLLKKASDSTEILAQLQIILKNLKGELKQEENTRLSLEKMHSTEKYAWESERKSLMRKIENSSLDANRDDSALIAKIAEQSLQMDILRNEAMHLRKMLLDNANKYLMEKRRLEVEFENERLEFKNKELELLAKIKVLDIRVSSSFDTPIQLTTPPTPAKAIMDSGEKIHTSQIAQVSSPSKYRAYQTAVDDALRQIDKFRNDLICREHDYTSQTGSSCTTPSCRNIESGTASRSSLNMVASETEAIVNAPWRNNRRFRTAEHIAAPVQVDRNVPERYCIQSEGKLNLPRQCNQVDPTSDKRFVPLVEENLNREYYKGTDEDQLVTENNIVMSSTVKGYKKNSESSKLLPKLHQELLFKREVSVLPSYVGSTEIVKYRHKVDGFPSKIPVSESDTPPFAAKSRHHQNRRKFEKDRIFSPPDSSDFKEVQKACVLSTQDNITSACKNNYTVTMADVYHANVYKGADDMHGTQQNHSDGIGRILSTTKHSIEPKETNVRFKQKTIVKSPSLKNRKRTAQLQIQRPNASVDQECSSTDDGKCETSAHSYKNHTKEKRISKLNQDRTEKRVSATPKAKKYTRSKTDANFVSRNSITKFTASQSDPKKPAVLKQFEKKLFENDIKSFEEMSSESKKQEMKAESHSGTFDHMRISSKLSDDGYNGEDEKEEDQICRSQAQEMIVMKDCRKSYSRYREKTTGIVEHGPAVKAKPLYRRSMSDFEWFKNENDMKRKDAVEMEGENIKSHISIDENFRVKQDICSGKAVSNLVDIFSTMIDSQQPIDIHKSLQPHSSQSELDIGQFNADSIENADAATRSNKTVLSDIPVQERSNHTQTSSALCSWHDQITSSPRYCSHENLNKIPSKAESSSLICPDEHVLNKDSLFQKSPGKQKNGDLLKMMSSEMRRKTKILEEALTKGPGRKYKRSKTSPLHASNSNSCNNEPEDIATNVVTSSDTLSLENKKLTKAFHNVLPHITSKFSKPMRPGRLPLRWHK